MKPRLAQRDPSAPLDDSAEFEVRGAVSFDDLLRRAQRRGFAGGAAAGALGAFLVTAAFSWTSRPAPSAAEPAGAERSPPAPSLGDLPPAVSDARVLLAPGDAASRAAGVREEAGVMRKETGTGARRSGGVRGATPPSTSTPTPTPTPAPTPTPTPTSTSTSTSTPGTASGDEILVLPALILSREGTTSPEPPPPAAAPAVPARRLEQAEVSAALAGRREAIEGCLVAHPAEAVAAGGRRFHLDVTVADSGRVSSAEIDDPEIRGTGLGACVLRVARGIVFPAFDGDPVRVELPLRLAPAR